MMSAAQKAGSIRQVYFSSFPLYQMSFFIREKEGQYTSAYAGLPIQVCVKWTTTIRHGMAGIDLRI